MIAVRYFSRSGNTKKLADAVAAELQVSAEDVCVDLPEKADILFLGSSLYAGSYDRAVWEFLGRNAGKIGRVVCFGSSASGKSTHKKIAALATEMPITVDSRFFNCPGKFLFMHRGRPNEKDLADAAAFARAVVSEAKAE